MLFLVILATCVDAIATITTCMATHKDNPSYAWLFGSLLGFALRALPIVMLWVLYAKV